MWGPKLSFRPAGDVVDEMEYLNKTFGSNFFFFTDLTFNINAKKVFELCDEITRRNLKVSWFVTANLKFDISVAEAMRDAGCSRIGFGIESLDPSTLHEMKPHQDIDGIARTLSISNSLGILNRAYFMIGYPWETPEVLDATARLMLELPMDEIKVSFVTPFPGTAIRLRWQGCVESDFSRYTTDSPVVRCQHMSWDDLVKARKVMVSQFYNSAVYRAHCLDKSRNYPKLKASYDYFRRYLKDSGIIECALVASAAD